MLTTGAPALEAGHQRQRRLQEDHEAGHQRQRRLQEDHEAGKHRLRRLQEDHGKTIFRLGEPQEKVIFQLVGKLPPPPSSLVAA